MPPLLLMRLLIGFFLGYYFTSVAFEKHLPPEFSQGAEKLFIETFLHGILSDPAEPSA